MAVNPPLALYTWYHQHRKKDLGVGQKDWLQSLQEQAKQGGQRECYAKSSVKTKNSKEGAKGDCVLQKLQVEEETRGYLDDFEQKELHHEGNSVDAASSHLSVKVQYSSQKGKLDEDWGQSTSHSQEMAKAQLPLGEAPATPLSALLSTSLSSPTLLLPHGNNTSVEETSLCSPTLPLCDEAFSPAKRRDSPRDTIMESLAGNLDGSEVSWSSALATPTSTRLGEILDGTSPSTLERQTLHPRQGLRENVLARSLFSPRTSGATSSSSNGELSPGLGIIKCFSPVPRFSCRSVSSVQALRPSCGESFNPGWLEGGTQEFRVFGVEKNVTKEKNAGVTPKDNLKIKTIAESGVHSPDRQISFSHSCSGVRPDQTSTPTQPRPVRARHLVLTAQSLESPSFIEPIPYAQEVKKNERVEETDSPPDIREIDKLNEKVTDSDGFRDDTSDVSEYSHGSAEDPFDIICSPVSKVQHNRKSNRSNSKLTSGKSKQQSEENILSNPIDEGNENTKQKPSCGDELSSHSEILPCSSSNKNLHPEIAEGIKYNKSKGESFCKDDSFFNKAKSNIAEDTNCKLEHSSKEHATERIAYQAAKDLTTKSNSNPLSPLSGKHVAALFAKTETAHLLENTNRDKEYRDMTSFDNRKATVSAQFSEQGKRKSIETLSLNKKTRFLKNFVYPSDLREGYEELNVSYTETIRSDKGEGKAATPGRKGGTCSTPTNGLDERQQNEASVPFDGETTCNTPTNRLDDEKETEAAVPDSTRVTCSSPSTPFKAREELNTITLKQKKFLPLSDLGDMDTFETSLRPSFERVEAVGYGHEGSYLERQGAPCGKKENESSDHNLQVAPLGSSVPYGKEYITEVTEKISAVSSILTENINGKYNSTSKSMTMSLVTTTSHLASVARSALNKNQEAQCYTDLPQLNVPRIDGVENLTTQESEGQRKEMVSSALNNQLVSDTYSDIDFSDSDLDISIPVQEESVTYANKNMKVKKGSNHSSDTAHREKFNADLFNKSHSDKNSCFNGFMTCSGKQIKISEKALLQARKFLEEQYKEEESLSPQKVPPGNSITIDYSMKGEKRETSNLSGMYKTFNPTQCIIPETGSLNSASDMSTASNAGISEAVKNLHQGNRSNVPDVKNGNKEGLLEDESVKEISNADLNMTTENRITRSNNNHEDNERSSEVANSQVIEVTNIKQPWTKGAAFVNVYETSSRKTADCSVNQPFFLKREGTADGTATEAEGEVGKEALGRVQLHCDEISMYSKEVKPPEDTETSSRSSTEAKSNIFQGFCTAAGSRVKISKEAVLKAQLLWEEVDIKMQPNLNKETNMQRDYNTLGNEQIGRLKKSTVPTELRKEREVDGSEGNALNKLNNKTSTALEMKVGFHTARGRKVSVNEASIAQAQLLWKETTCCETTVPDNARAQKQLSTFTDNKHFVEVDEGFHTAKGNKISVKESSFAQAYSLWKETVSCKVASPDHGGPKGQSISNDYEHYEVSCESVTSKSDGQLLKSMKSVPKLNNVQTNLKDCNSLSEKKVSNNEVAEMQGFITTSDKGNLSNTNTKASEKGNGCDKVSRKPLSRPTGTSTGSYICPSIGTDVNIIKSENLKIKPRRLFEDDKHLQAGNGCQPQNLVTQNRNDCKSYITFHPQNEKVDSIEGSCMSVSESAGNGSRTSGQSLYMNPLNDATKEDFACNLSEENTSTLGWLLSNEEMKAVINQSTESNASLNTEREKLLKGASQKMIIGHQVKSCDAYESIHIENAIHEARHFQSSMNEFCDFLTGNKKQVKISSESLQVAKQLLQECTSNEGSPEKFIEPSCGKEKSCSSLDNKPVATVESFMAVTDQNIGVVGETHEVLHGSPILGSQKRSKGKIVKRTSYGTTCQELQPDSFNTHEISDISDVTEAFLKDHLLDNEEIEKDCISQRKRSWGQCQDEEDSFTSKKIRRNVVINQHENMKNCDEVEASRKLAQKRQEKLVQQKERQAVRPVPGFLYKLRKEKKENRIKLHSLGSLKAYKKSRPEALGVTFSNALQYRFEVQDSTFVCRLKEDRVLKPENRELWKELKVLKPMSFFAQLLLSGDLEWDWEVRSLEFLRQSHFTIPYQQAVIPSKEWCDTMDCGDGCVVVPGTDGRVGVEELELGFLAMPGIHPGLLPPTWVPNHYWLIVWQLASMERRLPDCGQALILENVVARLKYRYDREIDRAERSILRKVTEQDDVPQKTMVLCITVVKMNLEAGTKEAVKSHTADPRLLPLLELTDGWYRIGAVVDRAMAQLIEEGKVKVGTKLVLHGAELVGSTSPCHPLQAPSMLCLRLHTNMTRRARWWARLGLLPQRGPIPSLIETTFSDGGLVGQVNVMVTRLYILYYDTSQGLFMGEKAHWKKLRETEKERERTVEQITAEVEKELCQQEKEEEAKRKRQTITPEEIRGLTMGQEISRLLDETTDPASLEGLLTLHQLQLARTWRERHAEEAKRRLREEVTHRLAKIEKPFETVPLLKVRIVDGKRDGALVTVWRPSLEFRETLSEESFFTVHYLMAAGFRWGSRQFTSTRQTKWERSTRGPKLWRSEYARSVTPLCLINSGELNPLWREVDVTGVVLRVGKPDTKFQTVHLVDHHLSIVAVSFWGGLKKCGYEDSVVEGTVVCLMNCSWRGHNGSSIGCIHFTELSIATCSPSNNHLVEASSHLRDNIKDMRKLLSEANKMLDGQLDSLAFPSKGLHTDEKTAKCKQDCSIESRPLQAAEENAAGSSKLNRQEQQAMEVQSKLRILSQYGSPGCPSGFLSPPSLRTHKPFQIPIRNPLNSSKNEAKEEN